MVPAQELVRNSVWVICLPAADIKYTAINTDSIRNQANDSVVILWSC